MSKNILLLFVTLAMPALAFANGVSTKYRIDGSGTWVTSEIKNAGSAYDPLLGKYLSDRLVKALREMSGVTSVQITKNGEEKVSEDTYFPYKTRTRKSNLFVSMNLPSRVSMLFSVEESYRECTKPKNDTTQLGGMDEGGGYSTSTCALNSVLKIKGPLSVQGSHANNSLVGFSDDEFKDLQDVTIDLSKSYDGKDLNLRTSLSLNSMLFERALARFLKTFKVQGVDMSVVGMSRQNILLGSSRMVRLVNEKILEDKAGGK